jgi:hypothetical protein
MISPAGLVFGLPEIRQAVVKRPSGIAQLPPMVEVLLLPAYIHHAVDRARSAQHLAPWPEDLAPANTGIRLGFITPVHRGIGKILTESQWDMDPWIGVRPAGFQQHDTRPGILAQPSRHDTAG